VLLTEPAMAEHVFTEAELSGLRPVPATWLEKSQVPDLAYASPLELAAERYASLYVSHGAGQRTEQLVTINGIRTLESYAAAARMLSRLAPVRGVAVDEVTPEAVSFLVNVRGDPEALRQAILRDGRLHAVDASRLIYTMSP